MGEVKNWLHNTFWGVLIWADKFVNDKVLFGKWETISARCGKHRNTCKTCAWLCSILDKIDPNHCEDAVKNSKENPDAQDTGKTG